MKFSKLIIVVGLFFIATAYDSFAKESSSVSDPDKDPLKALLILYEKKILRPAMKQALANKIACKLTDGYPAFKDFMLYDENIENKQQYYEIVRIFDAASF